MRCGTRLFCLFVFSLFAFFWVEMVDSESERLSKTLFLLRLFCLSPKKELSRNNRMDKFYIIDKS